MATTDTLGVDPNCQTTAPVRAVSVGISLITFSTRYGIETGVTGHERYASRSPRTTMSDDLTAAFDARIDDLPASVDRAAVGRMRLVARVLDDSIRIPGTDVRIGLDPLLGVLPVAGDVASGVLSLYIVAESARLGVSYTTLVRMLAHVAIDVAGGSIPVVGDIFDAAWKANTRNLDLALDDLTADGPASRSAVEIEIE